MTPEESFAGISWRPACMSFGRVALILNVLFESVLTGILVLRVLLSSIGVICWLASKPEPGIVRLAPGLAERGGQYFTLLDFA